MTQAATDIATGTDDSDVFEVRSFCKICHTNCGILVKRDSQENVLGIRGDPDHPRSRGYICPKGVQAAWGHNRPDRLNRPLLHGKETDWDTMLDDLAATIKRVVAEHGPNSIGIYGASGCEDLGWAATNALFATFGSNQFYTAATIDVGPRMKAGELVTGYAGMLEPNWDPDDESVSLLIFLGTNPLVSHAGMSDGARNLKRFKARGGRIWVLDPALTRTAKLADVHVQPIPGSDPAIFAWIVRELLAELPSDSPVRDKTKPEDLARLEAGLEPFTLEKVAGIAGVDAAVLQHLLDDIRKAGRLAALTGTGTRFGPNALMGEWLRLALLVITDSLEEPGGMWFNTGWQSPAESRPWSPAPEEGISGGPVGSRPEMLRNFAQIPCSAMADEIENGPLRILLINGGNPLTAFPEPEKVKRAFQSLDALVVMDVVPTSLTEIATHVFACTGRLERAEYNPLQSSPQYTEAVVSPVGDRQHLWYSLGQLGKRLGVGDKVLNGLDPDEATVEKLYQRTLTTARNSFEELKAAGPQGVGFDTSAHKRWARETAAPEGKWRVAPPILIERLPLLLESGPTPEFPLLLISGRQERRVNSFFNVENAKKADKCNIVVSPADAERYGLVQGELADLWNQYGTIRAEVDIDAGMREGALTFPQGWIEQNVCSLTTNEFTDPLTSQPQMTAIPVMVTPVHAETGDRAGELAEA